MEYKKLAILSSVAIVAVGAVALGVVFLRSRALAPAEEPVVTTGETPDANVGSGSSLGTAGTQQPTDSTSTGQQTTVGTPVSTEGGVTIPASIDENAKDPGCDTSVPDIDCDYDHLTNAEEKEKGTDPLKPDTDGDGITDGEEVYTWKTDPKNPRSVDPSMTDLEAVNAGKKSSR